VLLAPKALSEHQTGHALLASQDTFIQARATANLQLLDIGLEMSFLISMTTRSQLGPRDSTQIAVENALAMVGDFVEIILTVAIILMTVTDRLTAT